MRLLVAIAALLAATPAMATDWTMAAVSEDTLILTDPGRIDRTADGQVRASMLYVLITDEGQIAAIETYSEFDCPRKRYRRLQMIARDASGTVIAQEEGDREWDVAGNNDLGAAALDFICGGAKRDEGHPLVRGSLAEVIAEGRRMLREDARPPEGK